MRARTNPTAQSQREHTHTCTGSGCDHHHGHNQQNPPPRPKRNSKKRLVRRSSKELMKLEHSKAILEKLNYEDIITKKINKVERYQDQ
jgi:hypothetical protein